MLAAHNRSPVAGADTIACLTGYPQDMCVAAATHGPQACTLSLCSVPAASRGCSLKVAQQYKCSIVHTKVLNSTQKLLNRSSPVWRCGVLSYFRRFIVAAACLQLIEYIINRCVSVRTVVYYERRLHCAGDVMCSNRSKNCHNRQCLCSANSAHSWSVLMTCQ